MSGVSLSPATSLQARIVSTVSFQWRGVMLSAWSLIDQKSSAEQKRAKSQASAGGCDPSPPRKGRLSKNASKEKVVWTWRSPKRICFGRDTYRSSAAAAISAALASIRSAGAHCVGDQAGLFVGAEPARADEAQPEEEHHDDQHGDDDENARHGDPPVSDPAAGGATVSQGRKGEPGGGIRAARGRDGRGGSDPIGADLRAEFGRAIASGADGVYVPRT